MTQQDRDRLVVLRKAEKKLIGQGQAARELGITSRQIRRLLQRLKKDGDRAVIHKLRGRPSNRRTGVKTREKIVRVLSEEVYRDFGPTLASEYLADKHGIRIGREALRQVMISAGLWHARGQKVEAVHQWRERRCCRGELIQWDTSTHDWLEGRGETIYLIHMIDDATSELTARFVRHDSTEENMRVLRFYLERHGRPVAFYTDKASLFQTAVKAPRYAQVAGDRPGLPPTQIGRALRELSIVWLAAHSPQAKGRVERSFQTAQDRLVKGLRIAGVTTLEEANRYLDQEFMPWWNQHLVVTPANPSDAHRLLDKTFDLNAILSVVETRQVTSDYTLRFQGKIYRIGRRDVRPGLRGGNVRIEVRSGGSVHARFQERYLTIEECQPQPRQPQPARVKPPTRHLSSKPSDESRKSISGISRSGGLPVWKAAQINKTRG
jgi:biotin operon repressor